MLEIRLDTFPKHKVNLYDGKHLKGSKDIDDGLKVLRDATKLDNVFDNVKLQRKIDIACKLFKPIGVRIKR